jgi:hypothetical protein
MPTTSAYIEIPESQMKRIAQHINNWLKQSGATHQEFADRYNEYRDRMFPGEGLAGMQRYRVQAFINLARGNPKRNARVPRCREIEVISLVVGRSVEELLGVESTPKGDSLNATENQANTHRLLELMRNAEVEAQEFVAWSTSLPCSLETPEFMHQHHQALYSDPGEVITWDAIGNNRRNNLFSQDRAWSMTQLNFLSDLKCIAKGGNEYSQISANIRKKCLEGLAAVLAKPELQISLIVIDDEADDKGIASLKKEVLLEFDTILAWDDHFAVLRSSLGINYFSTKPRHVGFWKGVLKELRALAVYDTPEKVSGILKSMAASISEKPMQPSRSSVAVGRKL